MFSLTQFSWEIIIIKIKLSKNIFFLFAKVGSQHDMIVNVWDWRNNIKEPRYIFQATNLKYLKKNCDVRVYGCN